MDFLQYKEAFDRLVGVKKSPSQHEVELFSRAEKYIRYISWVPGIEMVAVVNSLSMNATHKDSDIDLFIITKRGYLWFVRVLVTGVFWMLGVWRKGEDVAGNFCLSFFITTDAMNLEKIAIKDDIYLYFWMYYLKPIFVRGDIYDRLLDANSWIDIGNDQKKENLQYVRFSSVISDIFSPLWRIFNRGFRLILEPKTRMRLEHLGRPTGVIITEHMLKFHNQDRREQIRDALISGVASETEDSLKFSKKEL